MKNAINTLKNAAQNEQTCIELNHLLKLKEAEINELRKQRAELFSIVFDIEQTLRINSGPDDVMYCVKLVREYFFKGAKVNNNESV